MVDPSDQFPPSFNVNEFLEPKPETLDNFREVCTRIDSLSDADKPSPDPLTGEMPDIKSLYYFRKVFANGSVINAHSVSGSEEYMEAWGETEPIRSIDLSTAEGNEYEYSAYTTGRTKLFVKKPGERVIREVDPTISIESQTDTGITVGIRGDPDFMKYISAALAERREADRLGLSKPTDGSLREFTSALQAAIDSGLAPDDSK